MGMVGWHNGYSQKLRKMIIYQSTKQNFISDVNSKNIDNVIHEKYFNKTGHHVGKSEQDSWRRSMHYMKDVLNDDDIPEDAGVVIEYLIPQTSKRIDFILTGQNSENIDHAVLIELKQWNEAKLSEKDGILWTDFYGEVNHPSYQVWSYAALMQGFNETVYEDNIQLKPCAYLHNYILDNVIRNEFYQDYIEKAPVFLQGNDEQKKLQDFIKQYVKHGDKSNIMYRIDHGKIKPSKTLTDSLSKMLKGNQEFIMIDDQKIVYETAMSLVKKSSENSKDVLIVEGGPGTGKSVVAINLLVNILKQGLLAQYVTKNAAPRAVYESKLTGEYRHTEIANLFASSGQFINSKENQFDALIVDEAHRLNEKSGMFRNQGENQIKEIMAAAKLSTFFVDEDQKVTWHDIGEKEEIIEWAERAGANISTMKLQSQFRCNGSDGYLAWLDDVLQIRETANMTLEDIDFDFQVIDSPKVLQDLIFEKNEINNKARLVAGYCWDWKSKNNPFINDIVFPEYSFAMKWNLSSDGSLWIMAPESVNEVGCIHTCQGLEVDYVGVIVGKDFVVRNGEVITDANERSKNDTSVRGYKQLLRSNPEAAKKKADKIIKNTYRTLMTRGMKGCYVYFVDDETQEYFKERIKSWL